VSRHTQDSAIPYQPCPYGIVTLSDVSFRTLPVRLIFHCCGPITPTLPRQCRFGLFPFRSPLLGKSIFLSFPAGTKMFQFSALAHLAVWQVFNLPGSPIRISTDHFLFADPRRFSQLTTSFFASRSLGILRSPFSTSSICLWISSASDSRPFAFSFSLFEIAVPNSFDCLERLSLLLQTNFFFSFTVFFTSLSLSISQWTFVSFLKRAAKVITFFQSPNFL
jgi:hypothetical protein